MKRYIGVEYTGRGLPLSRDQEAAQAKALQALAGVPGVVALWKHLDAFYAEHDEAQAEAADTAYYEGIRYALDYLCDAATAEATGLSFRSVRQSEGTYRLVEED